MPDLSKVLLTAALCSLPVAAIAAPTVQSLAALRTEVDDVAMQLETERIAAREELAALRAERAELQRQVRAETTRTGTLKRMRAEATQRAEANREHARQWHEPVTAALASAREHVEHTLPFARADRLAVLDRIERDLASPRPDYARAVERLLRFIEEEEAMGRELALSQQRVELDGEPQIVDVIRLGMAVLYIRTSDGRYGWAVPDGEDWRIELLHDDDIVSIVRARFEAHEANDALGPATIVIPEPPSGTERKGAP